jgi:2-C-methyl-D-erythritol 4-phosphate cytidylyltransferase
VSPQPRAAVIIPAAGAGRRMGGAPNPFLEVGGQPVLARAMRPFLEHPAVDWVVVALAREHVAAPPAWLTAMDPRIALVEGGAERGDSVRRALDLVPPEAAVVLVHDAARPLVSAAVVRRAYEAAARGRSVVAAVPVTDTIQEVDEARRIVATPDRSRLWRAQTPQAFPRAVLVDAYLRAESEEVAGTDEAALVTRYGGVVEVVEGDLRNLKLTSREDLRMAEALLAESA